MRPWSGAAFFVVWSVSAVFAYILQKGFNAYMDWNFDLFTIMTCLGVTRGFIMLKPTK